MATLYKYGLSLATALGLLLAVSCTKEDNSDCPPPGVALRCTYTMNEDHTCHFKTEVQYVDFFIYDDAGKLCMTHHALTSEMQQAEPYGMTTTVVLPAGKYTIAAWAHLNDEYHALYKQETFEEGVLATRYESVGDYRVVRRDVPHIFHSLTTVDVPMSRIASAMLDFTKNTNDIHVIIEGPGNYEMLLAGSNGYYRFDNTPADENDPRILWYTPEHANEPLSTLPDAWPHAAARTEVLGEHNIIRTQGLYIGDDTRLVIREKLSGDIIFDRSLTGMICEIPEIDSDEMLARYDHYDLRFKTDKTGMLVLVQVNDWEIVDQNHPLG